MPKSTKAIDPLAQFDRFFRFLLQSLDIVAQVFNLRKALPKMFHRLKTCATPTNHCN
jgi:hypothetical protein